MRRRRKFFCCIQTAADPQPVHLRLNRLNGKVIGVYGGLGGRRYLSIGRYA